MINTPASPAPESPAADSGLNCLMLMTQLHGISVDTAQLQHQYGTEKFTTQTMLLAAKKLGLTAKCIRQNPGRMDRAPLPAIAIDHAGEYFLVVKVDTAQQPMRVLIQRAGQPPKVLTWESFTAQWTGELIFFTSKSTFAGEMAKFDFTWFIPAVIKYRKTLLEILLISLVLQVIGLVTPMFFQVVMDKVLVNRAMQTLDVIAIGLIAATLFEAVLTGIRTAVFANTSSKIDVELGTRLFGHLLSLPISYFQSRRVGDSVARIRELENIRSFLTGNAMTLVLDVVFSFIFLGVMLWYSPTLTLVVVASIPVYLVLSFIFTPMLRTRLNDKFNRSAENQSFLVETLSGMDTVKAMAVEPRWQQKWDRQLAAYVSAGLSTTNIALVASGSVSLVSKLVTACIMWMGALLVIDNELTVGELVAFSMLAGQVSSPILRLAQLWNDFQQVGISMSRLGDILNARTEVTGNKTRIPRVTGTVEFDQVSFRYRADTPDVIRLVSLKVQPGEMIGIVGREKLTVTRSEGLPTLDFTQSRYVNGRPNQGLSSSRSTESVVGLIVNFPLFEGFARTYKLRGAEAQIAIKEAELKDTENQVLGEVVKAHADAMAALRNIAASSRLIDAARNALGNVQRKYDLGLVDIVEMLNVQMALADAEQERVRTLAEWRSARLRLMTNAGTAALNDIASMH